MADNFVTWQTTFHGQVADVTLPSKLSAILSFDGVSRPVPRSGHNFTEIGFKVSHLD
jgi:hypothetical protein